MLAAVATLFSYALARTEPGIGLGEARTAAVLTLTWIGFGVLSIVAAPLNAWRLTLIWALAAGFGLVLAIPATREFFALDVPAARGEPGRDRHRRAHLVVRAAVRAGGATRRTAPGRLSQTGAGLSPRGR